MRSLVRTVIALALTALAVIVPAAAASAKQPSAAKWASKHHFKGHWRKKDADKDGLTNVREFKLKTDPRRADSDRDGLKDADELTVGDDPLNADSNDDGVKDGAEHAGVVTAFDGTSLTLRQFHGKAITATLDPDVDCYSATDDSDDTVSDEDTSADDSTADDSDDDADWTTGDDDTSDDDTGDDDPDFVADASTAPADADDIDLSGDDPDDSDEQSCAAAGVATGTIVKSLELDREGGALVVLSLELA